tara:strand:- start:548 stop:835 length:288 start_codon:yes stop_codon:yes gene_type:complete
MISTRSYALSDDSSIKYAIDKKMKEIHTVYIVMAEESKPSQMANMKLGCYCVCDSADVAEEILAKDTETGSILPGGYITSHVLQTAENVDYFVAQ